MPEAELLPQETAPAEQESNIENSAETLEGGGFETEASALTEAANTELTDFEQSGSSIADKLAGIAPDSDRELAAFSAEAEEAKRRFESLVAELGTANTEMPPASDEIPTLVRPDRQDDVLNEAPTEFPATMRSPQELPGDTVLTPDASVTDATPRPDLMPGINDIPKPSGDAEKLAAEMGLDVPENPGAELSPDSPEPETVYMPDSEISSDIAAALKSKKSQRDLLKDLLSGPLKGNEGIMEELRNIESDIVDLEDSALKSGETSVDTPTMPVGDIDQGYSPTMAVEAPAPTENVPSPNVRVVKPKN